MKRYLLFPILFPGIILLFILSFCFYKMLTEEKAYIRVYPVEKVGRGKASKMEYCGHSYVVWQQNWSDCLIHDPDCKCGEHR